MNEFDMIERYFLPLTRGNMAAGGLKDDAAVLEIPEGHELVVTSDTLNEGVHFMVGATAGDIARKALRVNLSDLAAMGADPLSYQLNIAFPKKPDEDWLAEFCAALQVDNEEFGVFCSGGDTTSIKGDYLSVSITALGIVPNGGAVRRSGAKPGDLVVISGAVGDAYLGLKALQDGLDEAEFSGAIDRYRMPRPRNIAVRIIREYANAAADISDGLLADCVHIAKASGLSVEIDLDKMVFSKEVQGAIDGGIITIEGALKGGDDYELVMAVTPDNLTSLLDEFSKVGLNPLVIGSFNTDSSGLLVSGNKTFRIDYDKLGWKHF